MTARYSRCVVLVGLAVLVLPHVALANAGTPLMWLGLWRLVFINILIGVGEGLLIAMVFRTGWLRTVGIMLLANYFSWLIGDVALLPVAARYGERILGEQPLYRVLAFVKYLIAVAFGLSVLFEWPFCFWAFNKRKARIVRSTACAVAVNVLSYGALVWLYMQASGTTVLTRLTAEAPADFAVSRNAWVYYISPDECSLNRVRIDGTNRELLLSASEMSDKGFPKPERSVYRSMLPFLELYARPSEEVGHWDMCCHVNKERVLLLDRFAAESSAKLRVRPDNHGELPSVASDDSVNLANSDWKVSTGFWAVEGLHAVKGDTRKWLALELPFLNWYTRFATVIPGDQVVYQLGDQIVLLDLNADKIGVIARGYSPLVVLENGDTTDDTLRTADKP